MRQDFDEIIDKTAERIVRREPSTALTGSVMARVREGQDRPQPRRLVWATAGAGIAACGLLGMLMVNRNPSQVSEPTKTSAPPMAATETMPPSLPAAAVAAGTERMAPLARVARPIALPPVALEDDIDVISEGVDPIAVDSILVDPIEVQPVQIAAVDAIVQIEVEPLIVEPLSASSN